MFTRIAWSCTILLALAPEAGAQVKLAWKLKAGDRFFVEEKTTVRQTIKIMGTENRQDIDQIKIIRYTVLKKNADDSLAIEQKIASVKLKYSGAGPDADTKVLQQFEGASFQIAINPRGKLIKLEGYESFIKQIAKDNPADAKLVRALLTEESLKVATENLLGPFPKEAIEPGKTWQAKSSLPLGPLGTLDLINTFQLEKVAADTQVARITVAAKATYAPPRQATLALKIGGGDIRLVKSAGTVYFSVAAGRLERSEFRQALEGNLRLVVRDANVDMDFHQEQSVTLRVLAKNPLEK